MKKVILKAVTCAFMLSVCSPVFADGTWNNIKSETKEIGNEISSSYKKETNKAKKKIKKDYNNIKKEFKKEEKEMKKAKN